MKLIGGILDILYPEYDSCCLCGESVMSGKDSYICSICKNKLEYIKGHTCRICCETIPEKTQSCSQCVKEERYINRNISVFHYTGNIKKIIYDYKYYNKSYLYRFFGRVMSEKMRKFLFSEFDCITAVPLSRRREVKRGYNQAELIAKEISKIKGIPYKKLLRRKHAALPQNKLGKIERTKNIQGAFYPISSEIPWKNVLIVDDVYTTGATVNQCARILKSAGVKKVFSLTIAR